MRLLLISAGSVFVTFLILLTTRLWGLGTAFQPFQHPFFEGSSPLVIFKGSSLEAVQSAVKLKPDVAVWLDVETTSDQKLIVFLGKLSENDMSVESYRGPKPFAYTLQQLSEKDSQVKLLRDVLAAFPQQRFVLNIQDNVENVHIWVTDALKDLNAEKRILMQSNYNVIMESIKKREPFWLYGCSQADLMRFLTFQSLWILPATPFKGDVFIAPFQILGRPAFQSEGLEEIHRRHRKVVLGPVLNKAQFDDAVRLKADGLVVENLTDYLSWARP